MKKILSLQKLSMDVNTSWDSSNSNVSALECDHGSALSLLLCG